MAAFIISEKLTYAEGDAFLKKCAAFFEANPSRVDCVVSAFNDERFTWVIRRASMLADIAEHVKDGWPHA